MWSVPHSLQFEIIDFLPSCKGSANFALLGADKLIKQIGLRDNAEVVDLTGSKVVVESLTETKIMCTAEDKVS